MKTHARRIRRADVPPEPVSHHTDAVAAQGWLWISGMLPVDRQGTIVRAGDVVRQTEQILANIGQIQEGEGRASTTSSS